MNLRKPIATNKNHKPVIVFENSVELKEFDSIQAAAKWFKRYLGYKSTPFTPIVEGIFHDIDWEFNGKVYSFTTDETVKEEKLMETNQPTKKNGKLPHTGYWTFICNPKKWAIDDFLKSGQIYDTFSIRKSDKDMFQIGDMGVIRVGWDRRTLKELDGKERLPRGIYAIVEVIDTPVETYNEKDKYWSEPEEGKKIRYRIPVKYKYNLLTEPIYLEDLERLNVHYDKYLVEGIEASSIPLNPMTFQDIINTIQDIQVTQELPLPQTYKEGATKQITVNAYERNPLARQECIEHYGASCVVCNFNFSDYYGEIGRDFIHVHHLKELSSIQGEYTVDPINDLRPVCPNCHAMLHKRNPALSIEELKDFIQTNYSLN